MKDSLAPMLVNIFGSSPVQPLEKHIDLSYRCASELAGFFEAVMQDDWKKAEAIRDEIDSLEHEADELKKEIRLHLPKSLFMPVPRQDLLELLLVQDRIANRTRLVANTVLVRRMAVPAAIATHFEEFVARVIDATAQARKSVRELDELFTTGFRGAEVDLVESMIEEIDRIETETDKKQYALFAEVFAIEASLDPVHAMFLYRVIEIIGEIADMAERVGRRLELLLAN